MLGLALYNLTLHINIRDSLVRVCYPTITNATLVMDKIHNPALQSIQVFVGSHFENLK